MYLVEDHFIMVFCYFSPEKRKEILNKYYDKIDNVKCKKDMVK